MGKAIDDDGDGDIDDLCFIYVVKLFHVIIIRSPSAFSQQRFTPLRKPKLGYAQKHETTIKFMAWQTPKNGNSSHLVEPSNAKELTCTRTAVTA